MVHPQNDKPGANVSTRALDLEYGRSFAPSKVNKYFGVTVDQLRKWCADGTVQAVNIGSPTQPRYRISENEIRRWLREHLVTN